MKYYAQEENYDEAIKIGNAFKHRYKVQNLLAQIYMESGNINEAEKLAQAYPENEGIKRVIKEQQEEGKNTSVIIKKNKAF